MKLWLHLYLLTCILSSPSFRIMLFPKLVGLVLHVCASFSVLDSFMWMSTSTISVFWCLCILICLLVWILMIQTLSIDLTGISHLACKICIQFFPSGLFLPCKWCCLWCFRVRSLAVGAWLTFPILASPKSPSPICLPDISSAAAFLLSSPLPNCGLRPCHFPAHLLHLSACFFPSSLLNLPSPFCSSTRVIPEMHKSTHVCPVSAILIALKVKWSLC